MVLDKKEETTLSKLAKLYEMPKEFLVIAGEIELLKSNDYPNYSIIAKNLQAIIDATKPGKRLFKWKR